MNSTRMLATLTAGLLALSLWLQPLALGQEIKGQIKIGLHKVRLEQGKLYDVTLSGPPQLRVDMLDGQLVRNFTLNQANDRAYCIPAKTDNFTFLVTYSGFNARQGVDTIDYTLKFNPVDLGERPLISATDKLTDNDPNYKNQKKRFKAYPIQMSAGKIYVIDLVKDGVRDPYLFLEDAKGQTVASDDDGGGGLNSRIVFTAPQDGQYSIIATTLGDETGGFVLTVRGSK